MSPGDTYPKQTREPVASLTDECSGLMFLVQTESQMAPLSLDLLMTHGAG